MKMGTTKKAEIAIPISDKIDFKTKAIIRNKERLSNSTSGCLSEEDKALNWKIHAHLRSPKPYLQ